MNIFRNQWIPCYKKNKEWNCNLAFYGYDDDVSIPDSFLATIKNKKDNKNQNIKTIIIPVNTMLPTYFKKMIITKKITKLEMPKIIF